MKQARLEKELMQAGKELQLIQEGKIIPQSGSEFIAELKAKHGGKRPGSGKKSPLKAKYPDELKKLVTLRLYPTQLREIEGKYGSLQNAVDSLH